MGIMDKFTKRYVPKKGDIVIINRKEVYIYAVIISNNIFNINTKMVIVCPIINNVKYYPTRYLLKDTKKIDGSVMCEQVRSINYEYEKLKFIEKLNKDELEKIIDLMNVCINE